MTDLERGPFGIAVHLEHRPDRPYDEVGVSSIKHPNGSVIASGDRWFVDAALALTVPLYLPPTQGVAA